MSRPLVLLALLAAVALAACGGGGGDPAASPTSTVGPDGSAASAAVSADLPDGVAATVGGDEIASDQIEERVDTLLADPAVAEQVPGDESQQRSLVAAQVLNQLIFNAVVDQGAEAEGIEVTDEEVAQQRTELEEQAGGTEAFAEQLDQLGLSEEQLTTELRSMAVLDEIGAARVGEAAPASPGPQAQDPAQAAANEWLVERLQSTEIVVDEQYGSWDTQRFQVVPDELPAAPSATPGS